MLQHSRLAMRSALAFASVMSSWSHRRPRANDAIKVERVSDRIGRAACADRDVGTRISRRRLDGVLRHGTFSTLFHCERAIPFVLANAIRS